MPDAFAAVRQSKAEGLAVRLINQNGRPFGGSEWLGESCAAGRAWVAAAAAANVTAVAWTRTPVPRFIPQLSVVGSVQAGNTSATAELALLGEDGRNL
jgi:hypothetical protein